LPGHDHQLYTTEEKLAQLEQIAKKNQPLITIAPLKLKKIGMIVHRQRGFQRTDKGRLFSNRTQESGSTGLHRE